MPIAWHTQAPIGAASKWHYSSSQLVGRRLWADVARRRPDRDAPSQASAAAYSIRMRLNGHNILQRTHALVGAALGIALPQSSYAPNVRGYTTTSLPVTPAGPIIDNRRRVVSWSRKVSRWRCWVVYWRRNVICWRSIVSRGIINWRWRVIGIRRTGGKPEEHITPVTPMRFGGSDACHGTESQQANDSADDLPIC
jgi:hypothetical protein